MTGVEKGSVNDMVTGKVSGPVQDALKAYLELALGLTEASKKKAEKTVKKLAKELVGKGEATAGQLQSMAGDLMATSEANREAVARLVRVEMDRALSRVGLATADDVATLVSRIDALERQLLDTEPSVPPEATRQQAARKAAVAKKAPVVKRAPAKTVGAKKTTQSQIPVATPRKTAKATAKKAVRKSGLPPEVAP